MTVVAEKGIIIVTLARWLTPWKAQCSLSRSQEPPPKLVQSSPTPTYIRQTLANLNPNITKFCSRLSLCFKKTWYLGRQTNHLSLQTKLDTVSSNLQCYVKNKYKIWVVCWWINVLFFFIVFKERLYFHISYHLLVYHGIFDLFAFQVILSFRATFCLTNPDYLGNKDSPNIICTSLLRERSNLLRG